MPLRSHQLCANEVLNKCMFPSKTESKSINTTDIDITTELNGL